MSIPFYFKHKQALIDALEALRPAIEKSDKEAVAKHKIDEASYLKAYRAACKAACAEKLKLPYDEIKFDRHVNVKPKDADGKDLCVPHCPEERKKTLDRAVELVKRAPDDYRWRINPGGQYGFIHNILTFGAPKEKLVC